MAAAESASGVPPRGPERRDSGLSQFETLQQRIEGVEAVPAARRNVDQVTEWDRLTRERARLFNEQGVRPSIDMANGLLDDFFQGEVLTRYQEATGEAVARGASLEDAQRNAARSSAAFVQGQKTDFHSQVGSAVEPLIDPQNNSRYNPGRHDGMPRWHVDRALDRMYATFMQQAGLDIRNMTRLDSALRPFDHEWQMPQGWEAATPPPSPRDPERAPTADGMSAEDLLRQMAEAQRQFVQTAQEAAENQRMTLEQLVEAQRANAEAFARAGRRVSPELEHELYVELEYNRDFWTRHQPGQEPVWYLELTPEERNVVNARWQLARAATWKKINSADVEKIWQNPELVGFTIEQMERLYNIPGVRKALEWYVRKITRPGETVSIDGRQRDFWRISKARELDQVREQMRNEALQDVRVRNGRNGTDERGLHNIERMEADAIAWNFLWVSNLVESLDSRYSPGGSGRRHGDLPGILVSDDLRAVFHPQEKYENKLGSAQEWGHFGRWGNHHYQRLRRELGVGPNDRMETAPAERISDFWTGRPTDNRTTAGGRVFEIRVPECYAPTTMRSLIEEVGLQGEQSILGYLQNEEEVPWGRLRGSEPWVGYLPIKMNKADKLLEAFRSDKTTIDQRDLREGLKTWVSGINDMYARLYYRDSPLTPEQYHNLKVWAVYVGLGGMRNVDRTTPSLRLSMSDRAVVDRLLHQSYVGYLNRGEDFELHYGGFNLFSRLFK